jgi:exonuclease VII small subunit
MQQPVKFEDAMQKLTSIVGKLEAGKVLWSR